MHPGYQIGTLYLHCEPIDFRKQINSLSALVEGELEVDRFAWPSREHVQSVCQVSARSSTAHAGRGRRNGCV